MTGIDNKMRTHPATNLATTKNAKIDTVKSLCFKT